ncbi:MAG: hypothetical protein QXM37_04280 [Candidatus Bathyarchaeia archaeon]
MYVLWIKIDEKLPWIELDDVYQSKKEAQKAAREFLNTIKVKTVKAYVERKTMKTVAVAKRRCP